MTYDWRSRTFIALSVMGIAVAVYHGYGELTYSLSSCSFSSKFSCALVFGSPYTKVLGIQFWVYGVAWFPACLVAGLWAIRRYGTPLGSVLAPFLMIGNIFTIYPWYIEINLLGGEYCLVCISLYIINYVMTFVALASRSAGPGNENTDPPSKQS